MQAAVITFPGSNCDRDLRTAIETVTGKKPIALWHGETEIPNNIDLIGLPGGFSYGDYLRSGAMSARSPIMQEIKEFADKGKHIIGICNGFQVLTETGLLPGTLMRNKNLKFICKHVNLKVENSTSNFTKGYQLNQVIDVPIAHHDGNYFANEHTLKSLQDNDQIAFTYCDKNGNANNNTNPNGSINHIAGIFNKNKNVLGLMPHPERVVDRLTGGTNGTTLFKTLAEI